MTCPLGKGEEVSMHGSLPFSFFTQRSLRSGVALGYMVSLDLSALPCWGGLSLLKTRKVLPKCGQRLEEYSKCYGCPTSLLQTSTSIARRLCIKNTGSFSLGIFPGHKSMLGPCTRQAGRALELISQSQFSNKDGVGVDE